MKHQRWDDIEHEQLSPGLSRRVMHCDGLTVARIYLKKGAIVPGTATQRAAEQRDRGPPYASIFRDHRQIVAAGEMMQISANEPHLVEALEDSVAVDVFQPVREDWVRGDDSYLRNPLPRLSRNKIEN